MYRKLCCILQFIAVLSQLEAQELSPLQNLVTQAHDAISNLDKFVQNKLKIFEGNFTEASENLKGKIRDSLDGSREIPLTNIFNAGRERIKVIANVSGQVIEDCIEETEFTFLTISGQLSETQLACVSGKCRKILIAIFEVENNISAIQSKSSHLQGELLRCLQIEATENKQKCVQDDVITVANQQEIAGKEVIKKTNDLYKEFEGIPPKIQTCKDHIYKFATTKINKIVDTVPACIEKYKSEKH